MILANSSKDEAHLKIYVFFLIVLIAGLGIATAFVLPLHGHCLLVLLKVKIGNVFQELHETHLREESLLLNS